MCRDTVGGKNWSLEGNRTKFLDNTEIWTSKGGSVHDLRIFSDERSLYKANENTQKALTTLQAKNDQTKNSKLDFGTSKFESGASDLPPGGTS